MVIQDDDPTPSSVEVRRSVLDPVLVVARLAWQIALVVLSRIEYRRRCRGRVYGELSGSWPPPEGTHPEAGRADTTALPVPSGATKKKSP